MKPQPELALALLRVVVGALFFWHGWQKVFELGLPALTAQFRTDGVPLPLLAAPLDGVLELLGGLLLALGVGARGLAGLLALLVVLTSVPAFLAGRIESVALELALLMLTGCLAVLLGGSGALLAGSIKSQSSPPLAASPSRGKRKKG